MTNFKPHKFLEDVVNMIDFICNIPSVEEYEQSEIDYYEDLYKTYVLESIDDILCQLDFEDPDEYADTYDSYAVQYNPNNLVHYFKHIYHEKETR